MNEGEIDVEEWKVAEESSTSSNTNLIGTTGTVSRSKAEDMNLANIKYSDFRCEWQELGLFGEVHSFGITIRLYLNNEIRVKADGEKAWESTIIQTKSGNLIDRYDFFIGSKIQVYGRQMTIRECDTETCRDIEILAEKLKNKQNWLRSKIENVRAVPVVQAKHINSEQLQLRYTHTGKSNLKQLITENNKLCEQLCSLGLSHFLDSN